MNGACNGNTFLSSPPGALGRDQISFNFNYKVNFKVLYQTSCVFSQMKDTKHIRCPRGGTLGRLGTRVVIFFKHGHVAYQIDGDDEQKRMQVKFHPRVHLVTLR